MCASLIMSIKVVFLLLVLANYTRGGCTDRPLPDRPFYQPNPSYELISQIIPSGQPWPASVGEYGAFSQTRPPPNYTPLWATSFRPTTGAVPLPVNLEDRFKETENPEYGWFWPEGNNGLETEKRSTTERSTTVSKTTTAKLFTSAPAVLTVRIDDEEPKLENVKPVNLIPDKFMVTMKPPRDSVGSKGSTQRAESEKTQQTAYRS